jgi:hypothetical protein
MILALDQLLTILIKGKAPYLTIEGAHLVINPELGVVGFRRTMMICHIRSTNPMGGPLHLLLRSHTIITKSSLMTIQLLNLQDGKGKAIHRIAQNIHQMQEIIAQDFPTTNIFVLKEVRMERTFGFVVPLTVDLWGMKSACKTISLKELFLYLENCISLLCIHSGPIMLCHSTALSIKFLLIYKSTSSFFDH